MSGRYSLFSPHMNPAALLEKRPASHRTGDLVSCNLKALSGDK
jgi:hypothetical protein